MVFAKFLFLFVLQQTITGVCILATLWVEMMCPEHGLERFKIKIVKKFNIKADSIMPKYRTRPEAGGLGCLLVGRGVSNKEIEAYLIRYFRQKGLMEAILRMKLI